MLNENSVEQNFNPRLIEKISTSKLSPKPNTASICGIGNAFPISRFTQSEVQTLLGIQNQAVLKLLRAGHIQTRHLYLPKPLEDRKCIEDETHIEMNEKFNKGVMEIGLRAAKQAIEKSPLKYSELQYLICVTSSGFRVPGISSMIARALNLSQDLYRLDVVGMGCNAGMAALKAAAALSKTGMKGLVLCCEINSATYVRDESIKTGIVNSLFGDGAAAVVLVPTDFFKTSMRKNRNVMGENNDSMKVGLELMEFASYTIPSEHQAMRFEWDDAQKKWSFELSKMIPYVVSENLKRPVTAALKKSKVRRSEIAHWSIHTGGAAVIDGIKKSLGLSEADLRHTRSVLRDFGNISSGSFLVSLDRLLRENLVKDDDLGVLAAMGPGATLEACVVKYFNI